RILFKILSERQYEIINRAGGWIHIVTPDGLQNLLARNHLVFAVDKQFQEHGYFAGEVDQTFGSIGLVNLKVDLIFSEAINFRGAALGSAGALDEVVHPQQQFFEVKRFGEIIIGTSFEAHDPVGSSVFCS